MKAFRGTNAFRAEEDVVSSVAFVADNEDKKSFTDKTWQIGTSKVLAKRKKTAFRNNLKNEVQRSFAKRKREKYIKVKWKTFFTDVIPL